MVKTIKADNMYKDINFNLKMAQCAFRDGEIAMFIARINSAKEDIRIILTYSTIQYDEILKNINHALYYELRDIYEKLLSDLNI